ncbi:ABC transporter substrate-binding protein [Microbacterium hatanonis]|uniref:ABC transporter substrate-binding protein n=1 Tax=Microbacterium hatanonis TaxID=404366 RepID=UPI00164F558E|nr:ABC transporter substrate-binding protein [Microbacterium hatanonis]
MSRAHRIAGPRLLTSTAVLLVGGLTLSACAGAAGGSDGSGATAESIVVGTSTTLNNLNPLESQYSTTVFASYDSLVRLGDDPAVPEARLATEWTNPDDSTWVFTLREGVTFHDGSDFTAEDVVFTLDETVAGSYSAAPLLENLTWEATDDYTVTITTAEPDPLVLTKMSQVYIVPSDAWAELGAEAFSSEVIGTGSYTASDFVAGSGITFTAFDGFWGDAPATPTIDYRVYADPTSLASAIEAGELDVAHQMGVPAIETLSGNTDVTVFGEWSGNQNFFQLNTQKAPFDNVEVREAANLAIDVDGLIEALTAGQGVKEDGQLPMPGIFGHTDEITRPDYDPEAARALLEKNDAVGAEVTIMGLSAYSTLYEAIGAQLEAAGFAVTIDAVETTVWLQAFGNGTDADIFYRGMSYVGTRDADRPFSFVSTTARPMVVDPEWDALYAATKTAIDPAVREGLLVEASQYLADQSYILWTYGAPTVGATGANVSGVDFSTGIAIVLDTIVKSE